MSCEKLAPEPDFLGGPLLGGVGGVRQHTRARREPGHRAEGDAAAKWDAAGLRWTQWDWFPRPRRADLGQSEFTDAGRTECGFHAAGNGEIAGHRPFRWAGMGVL